ncbi:MAG: hypothetical protein LBP73_06900 [Clostridiales Family XIII bacterium]|nr:hypothetical protein [Clostridiales Family XIII bacterium]
MVTAATVNIYPVTIHPVNDAFVWNSNPIEGIARLTALAAKAVTNEVIVTAAIVTNARDKKFEDLPVVFIRKRPRNPAHNRRSSESAGRR